MSTKEVFDQQIKEQGDLVRKLKSAKESKERVSNFFLLKRKYYRLLNTI